MPALPNPYDLSAKGLIGVELKLSLLSSAVQSLKLTVADQQERIKKLEDTIDKIMLNEL